MAAVGRLILILTLVGAPWAFGSIRPWPQFVLAALIGGLTVLRLIETVRRPADGAIHIPLLSLVPLALLLIGAVQLLPRPSVATTHMEHAVFSASAGEFAGPDHVATGSLSLSSTRREAARLYFATAAFLLAAQWFADPRTHRSLFGLVGVNAAALGAFGIVQSLSWNGMLFWSVPLRFGGTPFASYVNRNNAAGYLNLGLAAAFGLSILLLGQPGSVNRPESRLTRPKLGWRNRLLLGIAQIDGPHLLALGLLSVGAVSVLFSLSRGGILAMLAAGVTVALTSSRRLDWRVLLSIGLLSALAAVGLLKFSGQFETVDDRLGTLSDPLQAAAGRLQHWQDTLGAVRDFPLLGTGFGTYRFANQPYQAHPAHAWYYNADNEWFELLVEMGTAGLVAVMLGFVLLTVSSRSLLRSDDPAYRAAGTVGLFIVISQALQGFTDFGLILPANGLTFAVLAGAVCGAACHQADFRGGSVPLSLSLSRLAGRPSQALLALVVVLSSAAFLIELLTATYAEEAQDVYVEILPDETPVAEIDAAIAYATQAVRLRPDDAELHQTLGNLWVQRCELQTYRRLLEDLPAQNRPTASSLWRISQLPALAIRVKQLESAGQEAEVSRIRSLLAITENLPQAQHHLEEALRHCSLTRGAALMLARLAVLNSPAHSTRTTSYLKKAQFIAPSTADVLQEVAGLARATGETDLADRCWHRALEVAPERGPDVWRVATEGRSPLEVMDSVVPRRVDALVAIAESVADATVREMLVARAVGSLDSAEESPSLLIRAKLASLRGDDNAAIRYYQLALSETPWDIESRWQLARLLHAAGRLSEADVEYSLLLQQAPNRKDIQQEQLKVQREMLETPVSSPNTSNTRDIP